MNLKYFYFNQIILIVLLNLSFNTLKAQSDIATARASATGSTITLTGMALNSDNEINGVIIYIQDSTAGIAIYEPGITISRGQSITLTGELVDYNNLLEISNVTNYTIDTSVQALPSPQIITPNELGDSLESELVQINDVIFSNGGSVFNGGSNYSFTSNGQTGEIRVNSGSPLVGTVIPNSSINLISIVSQYQSTYQLLPRDASDFIFNSSIYINSTLELKSFSDSNLVVIWGTNTNSNSRLMYGTDKSLSIDTIVINDSVTNHEISITGLQSGEAYYMKAYSHNGTDTAYTGLKAFTTISKSSGQINVYFNNEVDNSVSSIVDAIYSNAFPDTIISYIDKAQSTLDVCVYNNDNLNIVTAINNAYNRGVSVRYITHLTTMNGSLSSLNSNINVLKGNDDGLMHNKFIVVDKDSEQNSWILSGSTNWTPNNLYTDYNNMVFIQDQSLAKAYTIEFDEIWGSTGLAPDSALSKFGAEKEDNTPHNFVVDGKNIELYFSPSDQVTSKIDDALETADSDISFALLSFTRDELGSEMVYQHNAGVTVKGIIESTLDMGTEYDYMLSEGIDVYSHLTIPNQIHHKYCIIDALNSSSDPIVVTGSHNWSTSGEVRNDENTLIIHDHTIAQTYLEEFTKRYSEVNTEDTSSINELNELNIKVYPNPFIDELFIESKSNNIIINIYDFMGQFIKKIHLNSDKKHIDTYDLSNGLYLIEFLINDIQVGKTKILKIK